MHLDARDLRRFYLRTHLGRAAGWHIRDAISRVWPQEQIEGQTVVGYGFATPILRPFMDRARRVSALMPGQQGVFAWPASGKNLAVLCEETSWPLDTGSVDRLIVLHGLETCENPARLLDECWRVLGPGGHAIFIVPNRAGLWSRRDKTPFGYGRPYSVGQLETQLKAHNFVPETHIGALYQPPSHRRFWVRTGGLWEKVGRHLPAALASGVILVEATKQVYAPTRGGLGDAIKAPLEALGGLTKTPPKPVSNRAGLEHRSTGGKDG